MTFDCPRCGKPAESTYWGPCPTCRDQLAEGAVREARDIGSTAYEPKMNVVANQVATKD